MILAEAIHEGDLVVDATAGNGHDTAFLADRVGTTGKVIAFDIQPEAITSAQARVKELGFGDRVDFHQLSHSKMNEVIAEESVAVIMFNLGYLPGGNHALATTSGETIAALKSAARILKPGGILSVVCYPGHESGSSESEDVERLLGAWTASGWRLAKYALQATLRPAPFLLVAAKPNSTPPAPNLSAS
jgi:ubiquinone/menaquinone biosynthesis C-methylase UbiE